MSNIPPPQKLDFSNRPPLSAFTHGVKSINRKPDDVLKQQLTKKAQICISNGISHPYQCFQLDIEETDGRISEQVPSMLMVPSYTEKLFEGIYIKNINADIAHYTFKHIVGYDDYFDCPTIIIKDTQGNVVDIAKYRPLRDGYTDLPKYLYEKSENKPEQRGEFFLYLFQNEMERLITKKQFVFVGEGLKNALNALVRSIPFISVESASNAKDSQITDYVNTLAQQGISIYGAMDGDGAGEKALTTINCLLDKPISNLIDFKEGIDFTDYIKKDNKWN